MRGLLVCGVMALALVGCGRGEHETIVVVEPLPDYADEARPPREPIVPCTRLVEKDGRMTWKDTGKPFTGSTVRYWGDLGGGFFINEYDNGISGATMMLPEGMTADNALCRDAVRLEVAGRGPEHNDYFWYYGKYGDEADLPALFYDLKRCPVHHEGDRTWADCQRGHCLDALKRITGASPGDEDDDWAAWWRQKYGTEPFQWKPGGEKP